MNLDLKGQLIVVTGGSGLLGSLFVKTIRSAGGRCINADITCEKNLSADEYYLDITSEESIVSLIDAIVSEGNSISGWVNNAYPRTKDWGAKFEDIPFASWQKNVDMHLNGYFLCCQKVLEHMKSHQTGSLVNIGSIYGILGPDFSVYEGTQMTMPAGYAAIKGGITNLGRYLASYYGPSNIRVNTLSPGGIFDSQPKSFVKAYEAKVPLRRMGTPQDIAPALLFLLSDVSTYISGQNLVVDGGWSAI
jgi:NAD(P)-dependent dehydrogenase (short-subunit alcohol dehydrogenase family)